MNDRTRGQAIAETVIFLPVALLALWGVIWAAQYGVMSERVQSAVRYSGLISNQLDPYTQYSFYVLYNSQGPTSSNATMPPQVCIAPTSDALQNSGSYPGPVSGAFWMATPAPPTTQCSSANSQTAIFNVGGMYQPALALSNTPIVSTAVIVPGYLQNALGFGGPVIASGQLPVSASLNFIKPADMSRLMTCHPQFQTVIANSLSPPVTSTAPATTPAPLSEPVPAQSSIPTQSAGGC